MKWIRLFVAMSKNGVDRLHNDDQVDGPHPARAFKRLDSFQPTSSTGLTVTLRNTILKHWTVVYKFR